MKILVLVNRRIGFSGETLLIFTPHCLGIWPVECVLAPKHHGITLTRTVYIAPVDGAWVGWSLECILLAQNSPHNLCC